MLCVSSSVIRFGIVWSPDGGLLMTSRSNFRSNIRRRSVSNINWFHWTEISLELRFPLPCSSWYPSIRKQRETLWKNSNRGNDPEFEFVLCVSIQRLTQTGTPGRIANREMSQNYTGARFQKGKRFLDVPLVLLIIKCLQVEIKDWYKSVLEIDLSRFRMSLVVSNPPNNSEHGFTIES